MSDSVIHSLEEEIRYLRSLLDENGIAYDFGAFCKRKGEEMELSQMVPIDITPETAKFFFSMFHGRVDVYAARSNSGYYTVCNNRWNNGLCPKQNGKKAKCAESPNKDWPLLNSTILMRHMVGKREDCKDVIGVYVMLKDDTCRFIVFDFDNHKEGQEASDAWHEEGLIERLFDVMATSRFNLMTALQKYAKHFDTQQQKVLRSKIGEGHYLLVGLQSNEEKLSSNSRKVEESCGYLSSRPRTRKKSTQSLSDDILQPSCSA